MEEVEEEEEEEEEEAVADGLLVGEPCLERREDFLPLLLTVVVLPQFALMVNLII